MNNKKSSISTSDNKSQKGKTRVPCNVNPRRGLFQFSKVPNDGIEALWQLFTHYETKIAMFCRQRIRIPHINTTVEIGDV
jgi:hypothetical protein